MKYLRVMLVAIGFLTACANNPSVEVEFHRFDQLIFGTPASQLYTTLCAKQQEYSTPLLNANPHNQEYMAMLTDYVSDPYMQRVYRSTDSLYHDLGWLERELGQALARVPEVHYTGFYTLVDGWFDNYDTRVVATQNELLLMLDHYAITSGLPNYLARLSGRQYMAVDCMSAIARQHLVKPEGDFTLLDYAVAEGRTLYFVHHAMPHIHDTLLLRYTSQQLDWMERSVEHVWSYILQNNLLFSTDLTTFHNLIDEAPKTNAFGDGSAPRTTAYIGWKIVEQYMKQSGATLADLLAETDSRKILNQSHWRP